MILNRLFVKELKNKIVITNHEGCEVAPEYTYRILFDDFSANWNSESYLKENPTFKFVDNILKKIDSYCIYNNADIPEWFYEIIFQRRKFGIEYLGMIEDLIYTKDNFYAFKFLMKNYPAEFQKVKKKYLKDNFSSKKFDIQKHPESFYEFLRYSIQSSNKELQFNLQAQYDKLDNKENFEWIMYRLKLDTSRSGFIVPGSATK